MRRTEHRIHKYHGIIPSACMFPMSMSPCVCVRTVCYAACVKNVYVNRDAVRVNMWIVNEHNERSRGDAHTPTGTKPYVRTYVRSPEKSQRKSNTQLNVVNKPNNGILLPTHAPGQSLYIFAFVCVNVCVERGGFSSLFFHCGNDETRFRSPIQCVANETDAAHEKYNSMMAMTTMTTTMTLKYISDVPCVRAARRSPNK